MIYLTRLNQVPLVINSDLIEHIEVTPDTVVVLTSGEKYLVLESADEVIERVIKFRRAVFTRQPFCKSAELNDIRGACFHCFVPKSLFMANSGRKNTEASDRSRQLLRVSPSPLCGIIGGLILEGGRVGDITQLTAAMIVLGGTFGAVMVTTPMTVLTAARRKACHPCSGIPRLPVSSYCKTSSGLLPRRAVRASFLLRMTQKRFRTHSSEKRFG